MFYQEDAAILMQHVQDERVLLVSIDASVTEGTGQQCRDCWQNHLRPGLRNDSWSKEEDARILKLQTNNGNK